MASKLDPVFLERTRQEYHRLHAIKPREASAYLRKACADNGLNYKTAMKHLGLGIRHREMSIATQVKHAEQNSWARMIWEWAVENSYDMNRITVDVAYTHLMKVGRLPKDLTIRQVYEAMKRQNLRNDSKTTWKRIARKAPMEMWQMDFSKSLYFVHQDSDFDTVRCVPPTTTKRQGDGYALFLGIAIDMSTRVMYVEYFVSRGEDSNSVIDFALNAFYAKPGKFHLQGLPKCLYVDNGSGWVDGRTEGGFKKLLIQPIFGGFQKDVKGRSLKKRNKQGRGQVERSVSTMKARMEALLAADLSEGGKFCDGRKLSLEELNERVSAWIEEWNQGTHPVDREESKMNLFLAHAGHQFENLRFPGDDARARFSSSVMKTVIRRKILVHKGIYAFAPSFIDDGQEVEIVRDQDGYFLYHTTNGVGEMIKLTLEGAPTIGANQAKPSHAAPVPERRDVQLADLNLRRRFTEELERQMNLDNMNDLSLDEWEDVKPFFERPRTVEEIEEQVALLKNLRMARADGIAARAIAYDGAAPRAAQVPPITNNIIKLSEDTYVGKR